MGQQLNALALPVITASQHTQRWQGNGRIQVQCSLLPLDDQGDKDPEAPVKNGAGVDP